MSLRRRANVLIGLCFPRVSGDEPVKGAAAKPINLFSPRERG